MLQVSPTSLDLHYMSHRPGLGSLTVGIIKGVASKLFEIPELQVEVLETRSSSGQTHEVGSSSCCMGPPQLPEPSIRHTCMICSLCAGWY